MYYGEIKKNDIANGYGVRISLFVSGCRNKCKNCFNEQTWDFKFGNEFTDETTEYILELLKPSYVHGLTVLGGEPFEPENQKDLIPVLQSVRKEYPNKTIWCFSGFTYEELTGNSRASCEYTEPLIELIDVLVDGRYVEELKNISLRFRGSENQRIIDLNKTREQGEIVLWDEV